MAIYCIGDIQGCHAEWQVLLQKLDFSPSRDTVYVLGDLVNRGPESAAVVRSVMTLEGSAHCLLGNHDIHLLAVAAGVRPLHPLDTLSDLLEAPDAPALLDWLRRQPLAIYTHQCLMVHAGVQPQWDVAQTLACADEVSQLLRSADWQQHLKLLFGNQPDQWDDGLKDMERWRCNLNTLTRLRMLTDDSRMDYRHKLGPDTAPAGLTAWYDFPGRRTASTLITFGHWSTLGLLQRPHLLGLDTGCVWGGALTAAEILPDGQAGQIVQVPSQTRAPMGE
ncbi:MAG: symmetrical bis(5'-nucleosyl)-tetraphosphatase [Brachymonas sp.]|nr:symmetrical bis(5'-nucleosyl)-tetraphosphatase [Brachymonas sp.]